MTAMQSFCRQCFFYYYSFLSTEFKSFGTILQCIRCSHAKSFDTMYGALHMHTAFLAHIGKCCNVHYLFWNGAAKPNDLQRVCMVCVCAAVWMLLKCIANVGQRTVTKSTISSRQNRKLQCRTLSLSQVPSFPPLCCTMLSLSPHCRLHTLRSPLSCCPPHNAISPTPPMPTDSRCILTGQFT